MIASTAVRWVSAVFAADEGGDAREKARDILSQPRFADAPPTTTTSLPNREPPAFSAPWLEVVAWVLFVGILVAALVFIVMALLKAQPRVKRGRRNKKAQQAQQASTAAMAETELGSYEDERDIDVLLAAAARALADGNASLAIRLRFRAGLLQLDDAGRLEFLPTLTTRAVDRVVRSESFHSIGMTFDRTAYGDCIATAEEYELSDRAWAAVLAEPGRR